MEQMKWCKQIEYLAGQSDSANNLRRPQQTYERERNCNKQKRLVTMAEWKDAMQTIQHKQNNTPLPSYWYPSSLTGLAGPQWVDDSESPSIEFIEGPGSRDRKRRGNVSEAVTKAIHDKKASEYQTRIRTVQFRSADSDSSLQRMEGDTC